MLETSDLSIEVELGSSILSSLHSCLLLEFKKSVVNIRFCNNLNFTPKQTIYEIKIQKTKHNQFIEKITSYKYQYVMRKSHGDGI